MNTDMLNRWTTIANNRMAADKKKKTQGSSGGLSLMDTNNAASIYSGVGSPNQTAPTLGDIGQNSVRPNPRSEENAKYYAPVESDGRVAAYSDALFRKNQDNMRGLTGSQASFMVDAKSELRDAKKSADFDRFLARGAMSDLSPGRAARLGVALADSEMKSAQAIADAGAGIGRQLQERDIKATELEQAAQLAGLTGATQNQSAQMEAAMQGQKLREQAVGLGQTLGSQEYISAQNRASQERITDQNILGNLGVAQIGAGAKNSMDSQASDFVKELMKPGLMLTKDQIKKAAILNKFPESAAEELANTFGSIK